MCIADAANPARPGPAPSCSTATRDRFGNGRHTHSGNGEHGGQADSTEVLGGEHGGLGRKAGSEPASTRLCIRPRSAHARVSTRRCHGGHIGSTEQGRLGLRTCVRVHPAVAMHPAAQRARPSLPSLLTRSRARRGPRMRHPGRLGGRGKRAAGGPGPEPPMLRGRGALIGMAGVQGYRVQGCVQAES
jgi:hypothetical protein